MTTFGDRLREARTAAGLTQEQFGYAVGVTNSAVSAWENGRDVPSFSLLPKIREVTKRSLDELVCGEGSKMKAQARAILGVMEPATDYVPPDTSRARDAKELAVLIRYRGLSSRRRDAWLELLKPTD